MLQFLHRLPKAQDIHLDLDKHLNKIIPPSLLWRLPRPISHFLGYREKPKPDVGNVLVAISALVGNFVGLLCVAAATRYSPWIAAHHPPVLLASVGAAAVLEYNTILSPIAQPRNSIIGHALATLVGVCIAKLMLLSSDTASSTAASEAHLSWILAPLACAVASAVMTMLNCIYPPGGATAILAVADPTVRAMGWYLILLVLIYSLLIFSSACVVNNVLRRYPLCWWTSQECGSAYRRHRDSEDGDVEKLSPAKHEVSASEESVGHIATATATAAAGRSAEVSGSSFGESIVLSANGVLNVPHNVQLAEHERQVLHTLLLKLQAPSCARAVIEKSGSSEASEPR